MESDARAVALESLTAVEAARASAVRVSRAAPWYRPLGGVIAGGMVFLIGDVSVSDDGLLLAICGIVMMGASRLLSTLYYIRTGTRVNEFTSGARATLITVVWSVLLFGFAALSWFGTSAAGSPWPAIVLGVAAVPLSMLHGYLFDRARTRPLPAA